MKKSRTEKELLVLLKKGDITAFNKIYKQYSRRLYSFVLRFLKRESDAEEIVQEVFLKIWESRRKIDTYASFDAYIYNSIQYNNNSPAKTVE